MLHFCLATPQIPLAQYADARDITATYPLPTKAHKEPIAVGRVSYRIALVPGSGFG